MILTLFGMPLIAYRRVSLYGPSAELDGGVLKHPRPGPFGAEQEPGAG